MAMLTIEGPMKYRATFSDGTMIMRKSEREYNAAWRMVCKQRDSDDTWDQTGFARTKELAQKAYSTAVPRGKWNPRRKSWTPEHERVVSFEVVETEYLG